MTKARLKEEVAPVVPAASPCYCYIVECADGSFYTGWTTDTERRLKTHNAGRGARYTSARRPVKLVYVEPQPDRNAAMKRELAIKRLPRARKQALIDSLLSPAPRRRKRQRS
jgi:putative endonuclease